MQRSSLVRTFTAVMAGLVVAACDAPPPAAPLSPAADQNAERASLQAEIGVLERLLGSSAFDQMLRGPQAKSVPAFRQRALDALAQKRERLSRIPGGAGTVAHSEIEMSSPPWCMQGMRLDDCFSSASTTIESNGTGRVGQVTLFPAMHGTVTFITDNGVALPPILKGVDMIGYRLDEAINFREPSCNVADHRLVATTVHMISISVGELGQLSGAMTTGDDAECTMGRLTVKLEPPEIEVNSYSSVTVMNAPADCDPTIRSSNPAVATIQYFGTNMVLAMTTGPGSTTISASCPNGANGSAVLTVKEPRTDNPDRYERNAGGGADASDCDPEYTYYHMRFNYARNEYEWTGGVVCLPGETRTYIYLPVM